MKPTWAYKDYTLINRLASIEDSNIYLLENLDHNYSILNKFKSNDFLFILIGCFFDDWNFQFAKKCLDTENPNLNIKNVIWMCNTLEQLKYAEKNGFDFILCNHNALIDENKFIIKRRDHRYDLVMNCRPDVIKRPWLAAKVDRLAIVKGASYFDDRFWDLSVLNPLYMNEERITAPEIVDIYGHSLVGGVFSEKEGACYASGEYLLCGLPVVSTYCQGGRELWYNSYNSIITNPDNYEIKLAVEELGSKIKEGKIDFFEIRNMHINTALKHRANLLEKITNRLSAVTHDAEIIGKIILHKILSEKVKRLSSDNYELFFNGNK